MSGIEPVLLAGGVWLWENYGKDAFSWLVKRLGKRAEDFKAAGWEKIDWALASRHYREELNRLYGTMHIFGMSQPVPLGDIFTDVYLLGKPSACGAALDRGAARAADRAGARYLQLFAPDLP